MEKNVLRICGRNFKKKGDKLSDKRKQNVGKTMLAHIRILDETFKKNPVR